jgi:hypothetical protein
MKKIYSKFEEEVVATIESASCADEAIASVADSLSLEEGTATIKGVEYDLDDLMVVDETYTLWSLDVWGDADEWTVNDRGCCGEVAFEDASDDDEIKNLLVEKGLLDKDADIEISGDDNILYIDREYDGFPLFELEKVNWQW